MVDVAIEEAKTDAISEDEANAQAEQAALQGSLAQAVDTCKEDKETAWSGTGYISVDEAGLFIDGDGDESAGASIEDTVCILSELDIPNSVIGRIEHTTSQMGLVDGQWSKYEAQWSYHPDNGLDMTIVAVG